MSDTVINVWSFLSPFVEKGNNFSKIFLIVCLFEREGYVSVFVFPIRDNAFGCWYREFLPIPCVVNVFVVHMFCFFCEVLLYKNGEKKQVKKNWNSREYLYSGFCFRLKILFSYHMLWEILITIALLGLLPGLRYWNIATKNIISIIMLMLLDKA